MSFELKKNNALKKYHFTLCQKALLENVKSPTSLRKIGLVGASKVKNKMSCMPSLIQISTIGFNKTTNIQTVHCIGSIR